MVTAPPAAHLEGTWVRKMRLPPVHRAAILDRLLGNAVVINVRGELYRTRKHRNSVVVPHRTQRAALKPRSPRLSCHRDLATHRP